MKIEDLGFNISLEKSVIENNLEDFEIGRIIAEHKERYTVSNGENEFEAEITGNLRFTANNREDFPAVGDWVALISYDPGSAIIHKILPRSSAISRKAVGKFGETQIIATNIDYAFIVQSVDRDFNLNRLERYLTICHSSRVKPIIVLSKIDLIESQELTKTIEAIKNRIKNIPILPISNETRIGYEYVEGIIEYGKTYCLLGSSGVGKSTLMNNISGTLKMKTSHISKSTEKGRHITSHRELMVLNSGGILIDNPGMREIGITDPSGGLEATFGIIKDFSAKCKFTDCTHTDETGCAVIEAVGQGEIDKHSYENFLKMVKEKEHFDLTVSEKRKKDKSFGKMVKNFKKEIQDYNSKHDNVPK